MSNMFEVYRDDAERLATTLNRITIADLIEKMEVSIMPFSIKDHEISSLCKLKIKLYDPKLYPPHADITLKDCRNTLEYSFLRQLEDAIENHMNLLSKISGITSVSQPNISDETVEDGSGEKSQADDGDDDDDDEDNGNKGAEDLGSDGQRSKQATDEIDYEENLEEAEEQEESQRGEAELTEDEDGDEIPEQDVDASPKSTTEQKEKPKVQRRIRTKKDTDRECYIKSKGMEFEVHFKLRNEPHILLAQVC